MEVLLGPWGSGVPVARAPGKSAFAREGGLMGNVEQLDLRRKPGVAEPAESDGGVGSEASPGELGPGGPSRFEALVVGESAEAVCALCGGSGRVWRDEHGFLQQSFEHEDPCLLDVLMRHVTEEIRLKMGLGLIHRHLLAAELTDVKSLRDTNLLVLGWVARLLAGEDIALSPYTP
jgi:hypothetical protein